MLKKRGEKITIPESYMESDVIALIFRLDDVGYFADSLYFIAIMDKRMIVIMTAEM